MIFNEYAAKQTAQYLLQINAIKLKPENYFTWASGWHSPIYCDNRIILSYPGIREFVAQRIVLQIQQNYPQTEVIAGVATGAIGIGMLVANLLKLPFIYVRPEPKKHGRQNQIEGLLEERAKVIVVEDLISTGMSSLNAVRALRDAGADILGMLAIFSYGFKLSEENFQKENVILQTLSDYDHLLKAALKEGYIENDELETLQEWRKSPETWKK